MDQAGEFTLRIEQVDGFEFRVRFDEEQYADLRMDAPAPLGHDAGIDVEVNVSRPPTAG